MDIMQRIEDIKRARNWSEYRLAKEAGISQSTLSNIVNRGNSPSLFTLTKICNAFDISLAQFFDTEDKMIGLTKEQKALIDKWNRLSRSQKERVNIYIDGMLTA